MTTIFGRLSIPADNPETGVNMRGIIRKNSGIRFIPTVSTAEKVMSIHKTPTRGLLHANYLNVSMLEP